MLPYHFLLFDAARAGANLVEAQELNPLNRSLYKGTAEEDLAGIAPYLFTIKHDTPFADWYLTQGWGKSWGLLVNVTASFEDVYKHFRRFLMVKTEDGQQLYFRFYDPRVLRIFLPTCDKEQLKDLFGPVKSFIMEDADPAFVLQLWLENYELKQKRTPVAEVFGEIVKQEEESKTLGTEQEETVEEPVTKEPKIEIRKQEIKIETTAPVEPGKKKRSFF